MGISRLGKGVACLLAAVALVGACRDAGNPTSGGSPSDGNGPLDPGGDLSGPSLTLSFATYLGGSAEDVIRDVVTDPQGFIYVAGGTASPDFPVTAGAYDRTFNSTTPGLHDVFVAKLDPSGALVWSTYIGGPGYDRAYGIEIDRNGYVYVAGRAGDGFPVTQGAFQTQFGGSPVSPEYGRQDGFVCKLAPDGGSLDFCSYFGTSDDRIVRDLAVDANGDIYLAASVVSGAFPAEWFASAFQPAASGGIDLVVAKVATDGSAVRWATYLGGGGDEASQPSIRVDSSGHAYVTSSTTSGDMPTPGGFDPTYNGGADMYVAKLTPGGDGLVYGTYLGGTDKEYTETHELAIDALGHAYVATTTLSSDFPVTGTAVQKAYGGAGGSGTGGGTNYSGDIFVAKISPSGAQLLNSSYVGGRFGEGGEGVGVDALGNVLMSGATFSDDFPLSSNASQKRIGGAEDAVAVMLSPDLSTIRFSTYLGGSGQDWGRTLTVGSDGSVLLGGATSSFDLPTHNARQPGYGGGAWDGFLVKLAPR